MDHDAAKPDAFGPLRRDTERFLAQLLTATFHGKDEIAQQLAVTRGRVIDADGSLELSVRNAPPASVARRVPVEAEAEDIDGITFHVLLHVVDGYVDELEVYREDGQSMKGPIQPDALRVRVL